MSGERSRLLRLAEKVSDGRQVDWEEAESHSGDDHERKLIRRLRVVSSIAASNRRPSRDGDATGSEKKTRRSVRSSPPRH